MQDGIKQKGILIDIAKDSFALSLKQFGRSFEHSKRA